MNAKLRTASLAAAALITVAGMANAAPLQINIYGASAQGDFWVAEIPTFLGVSGLGCTTIVNPVPGGTKIALASGTKVKYGYGKGTSCSNANVPADGIEIRTGGIASLEGPLSVNGQAPIEPDAACHQTVAGNPTPYTVGSAASPMVTDYRLMANSDGTTLGCYQVNIGTTDLDGKNIDQSALKADGSPYPIPDAKVAVAGLNQASALVVPFSLAINSGVTARHCYTGTTAGSGAKISGSYCTADDQCGMDAHTNALINHCNTTYETIDNLSRLQALMLFGGQVPSWKYLGDYFGTGSDGVNADGSVVTGGAHDIITKVCLRQPGSGTHAVLQKMLMQAGAYATWGAPLAGQDNTNPDNGTLVSYVKSSDDMVTCIQSAAGAIGYLDADKDASAGANVVKVKYNGNYPSRVGVRNGIYDYYGVGQIYTKAATLNANTALKNLVTGPTGIITFAQNGANIPTNKRTWWATLNEMVFNRDLGDLNYPRYVGATTPLAP